MEMGLGWLGVAVGAVGFVLASAMTRASAEGELAPSADQCRRARLAGALTMLLTLVFWAVAMRSDPPFSRGQTLGYGFLIGGTSGALMCVVANWLGVLGAAGTLRTRYLAVHSAAFPALAGVSLAYVVFRSYPSHALIGFALGAVMGAIVRFYVEDLRSASDDLAIQAWAVLAVTLAASVFLAVEHFDTCVQRTWWPLPILMGVTVIAAGLIGTQIGSAASLSGRPGVSGALSSLIASVLTIGLSLIYGRRLVQDWRLAEVTVIGIACAAAAAWLVANLSRKRDGAWGLDAASACVLLLVAFAVVEFKLWSGLGIGIGLVAAWAVVLPLLAFRGEGSDDAVARALSTVLFVGLSILLYRVFIESIRPDMSKTDLRVHYSFIGALIGAIFPFVLSSSIYRLRDCAAARAGIRGDLCALAGAACLGLFAAASPVVIYLVWELKAVVGLVYGLVASGVFLLMLQLFQQATPAERRGASPADHSTALLVVGAQLAAIQFVRPLVEITTTRAMQVAVISAVAVLGAAWLLVTGISSQRSAR